MHGKEYRWLSAYFESDQDVTLSPHERKFPDEVCTGVSLRTLLLSIIMEFVTFRAVMGHKMRTEGALVMAACAEWCRRAVCRATR